MPLFVEENNVATLRAAFRMVRLKRPFTLDAAVVLPGHLDCIWTLPPGDTDFSTRWRLIKTWFTKHCDSGGASGYAGLARRTGFGTSKLKLPLVVLVATCPKPRDCVAF